MIAVLQPHILPTPTLLATDFDDPSCRPSSDSRDTIINFGGSGGGTSDRVSSYVLSVPLANNPSSREASLGTDTLCTLGTLVAACLLTYIEPSYEPIRNWTGRGLTAMYIAEERMTTAPMTERSGGVVLKNTRSNTRENII